MRLTDKHLLLVNLDETDVGDGADPGQYAFLCLLGGHTNAQ